MLPQRVILSILAFLGIAVHMTMRVALSIAITEMVEPIEANTVRNNTIVCPVATINAGNITVNSHIAHSTETKYKWSQEEQGWVLSSYFGGYLLGHIPGSIFPQKYSAKWMFSLSTLVPSICNAALPLALRYGIYEIVCLIAEM